MKETKKCDRCGIAVEVEKISVPNRCPDRRCPLNDWARANKSA